MSILIKGMEMPTSCSECGQFRWDISLQGDVCRIAEAVGDNGKFHSEDEGIKNRPLWCPLVPVPPHGRLIDADNLLSVLDILCDKGGDIRYWEQLTWITKDCPTIIEAEE